MKTFRLLMVALLFVSTASAQRATNKRAHENYAPTVTMISVSETEMVDTCCCPIVAALAQNRLATAAALDDYRITHRPGFSQSEKPQYIFTNKSNRFSFAIGGYINLRAAYDMNGIVDNIDFVPSAIPMQSNYATQEQLMMDATTSRFYLKAITHSRTLGRVVIYVETDFRGGNRGSYTPRLRMAYVSFKGFTFGRDVTTFCDLAAGPNTIDFQGPNGYNFNFATMIRYEVAFANNHMKFGVAAEMPSVSGTYGDAMASIPQRMPDFPLYMQVAWGANRSSHLRASAVFRNMYVRNLDKNYTFSKFGWGVQGSGFIKICRALDLYFNGVYGEGITPYIQDLSGLGLDFTPVPGYPTHLQTMPMYSAQAALQINLSKRVFVSGGYSMVTVCKKNGAYADDEYKEGQYMFGNIFYQLTPRCKIAAEYLYGTRKNMDNVKNHANRVNLMVQYNF